MTIAEEIRAALAAQVDTDYRDFHAKLVPNVAPERIIGVRLPAQRAVAKAFKKDARVPEFLAMDSHAYVEEINVHGFLIAGGRLSGGDRALFADDRQLGEL